MSVWTTPLDWVNGAVTESQMDTEIRDHFNFLKGFADLITNSTTADTGTTMYLQVRRTASTDAVFEGQVGAEANPRLRLLASGTRHLGAGGASAPDVGDKRSAIGRLVVFAPDGTTAVSSGVELLVTETAASRGLFVWRAGDTTPRAWLGQDASGFGGLLLGDGTAGRSHLVYDTTNGQTILDVTAAAGSGAFLRSLAIIAGSGDFIDFARTATTGGDVRIGLHGTNPHVEIGGLQVVKRTGNVLGMLARVEADEGITTYVKGGVIGDGDFSSVPASGTLGVDTANGQLDVKEATTWRKVDLRGDMVAFVFEYTNLAASQTGLVSDWANQGALPIPMAYGGSIVGISVRGTAACTAGSATFKPSVSGVTGTLSAAINTTDTTTKSATQAPGVDTFNAGQTLRVEVTTTAAFLPTGTTEYAVVVYVLIQR